MADLDAYTDDDTEDDLDDEIVVPDRPLTRRPAFYIAGVPALALAVSAGVLLSGHVPGIHSSHTLTGSLTLYSGGSYCLPTGGYSDIGPGATVTVKNQNASVIATSALQAGSYASGACVFKFSVPTVPGAKFYTVEVSHRGGLTYSAADMAAKNYNVDFSLGS